MGVFLSAAFFNHTLMLPCLFVIADPYQQYISRIPFQGLRIFLLLDLPDSRISPLIPFQLYQQGWQIGVFGLGQERQVGEALAGGEFTDETKL